GAVRRRPDTQHGVRTTWIARELHFTPGLLQRHEHLLTLTDGAAIVGFTLHDQRWRGRAMRKRRRRMRGEGFARLVRTATPLVCAPGMRDVAGAVHRFKVEARRSTHGRLETQGVTDCRGSHEAATAIAPDTNPLLI